MLINVDSALNPDGTSFCERLFPAEKLKKMQSDNPAVFAAQYQNDVEAMREMVPIKQEWAKIYNYSDLNKYGLHYQIAIDPGGIKEQDESSAMGVSVVGVQSLQGPTFGHIYALESLNLFADPGNLAKSVVNYWEQYDRAEVKIEDVALQMVFAFIFEQEAKRRNHPHFPITGIKGSELKDKITLARSTTTLWTRGQVHIDPNHTPELYGKLEDYPQQGTDDVNALLINLYDLKKGWIQRSEPKKKTNLRQPKRSKYTGY